MLVCQRVDSILTPTCWRWLPAWNPTDTAQVTPLQAFLLADSQLPTPSIPSISHSNVYHHLYIFTQLNSAKSPILKHQKTWSIFAKSSSHGWGKPMETRCPIPHQNTKAETHWTNQPIWSQWTRQPFPGVPPEITGKLCWLKKKRVIHVLPSSPGP